MSNLGIATYDEMRICDEFATERRRAHQLHGETSMEQADVLSDVRLSILAEELGEVARCLNDIRHMASLDAGDLPPGYGGARHAELVKELDRELNQVGAMALTWRANLTGDRLAAVAS